MQQNEKRIVALSVAVTLLGGWVTIGEAEALGPEGCANHGYGFPAEGFCRSEQALIDFCSEELSNHYGKDCVATSASSCTLDNGYQCTTQAP